MSEAENREDRLRRVAWENRLRKAAKAHGLGFSRGRGYTDLSPNRGLYRLKNAADEVVMTSYDLADIEAYLRQRTEEERGQQRR
jgi:hypothetical protein